MSASISPPMIHENRPSRWAKWQREISVAAAYLLLLLALAVLRPEFYHLQFREIWISAAPMLIVSVGMTLVILAREIDISVGSQFSVCGTLAGTLAAAGCSLPITILLTLLAGAMMGAGNGVLIAVAGLPSIVVTLATMVILRGAILWSTQGAPVHVPFQWLGLSQSSGQWFVVLAALLVFAVFAVALQWLPGGRAIYAVGSDSEAARLAGIRPKRVVFWVFVLMGTLTALAALLNTACFELVYPNTGEGLELQTIAAVVIGGTAISGGRGQLLGTLIGVALLATIGPALLFFHAHSQWAKAIQGLIILLAVASDAFSREGQSA
ncbi:MAG TPA: ABC transporter permease [Tepidisphaeraceae bacterium]|jgi:rhamnose transport system permease protein